MTEPVIAVVRLIKGPSTVDRELTVTLRATPGGSVVVELGAGVAAIPAVISGEDALAVAALFAGAGQAALAMADDAKGRDRQVAGADTRDGR